MAHPALTTDYKFAIQSNIITMSTVLDRIDQAFFCKAIYWNQTTAYNSTMALHIQQSTVVTGTTYMYPLIGTSAAAYFPAGGHTTLAPAQGPQKFDLNCVVAGLVLSTLGNGSITIIKGYMSGTEVRW